jgi:hypothetical protein
MQFIKSNDPETIEKLKECGFTLLSMEGNMATFANDAKPVFSEDDEEKPKMAYTNRINI